MHTILFQLFGKDKLEEIELHNLEALTREYPYYPVGQYLLMQKYRSLQNDTYQMQAGKTAIFFNNPHWLHWLLDKNSGLQVKESITEEQVHNGSPIQPIEAINTISENLNIDAELQEDIVDEQTELTSISENGHPAEIIEEPVDNIFTQELNIVEVAEIYVQEHNADSESSPGDLNPATSQVTEHANVEIENNEAGIVNQPEEEFVDTTDSSFEKLTEEEIDAPVGENQNNQEDELQTEVPAEDHSAVTVEETVAYHTGEENDNAASEGTEINHLSEPIAEQEENATIPPRKMVVDIGEPFLSVNTQEKEEFPQRDAEAVQMEESPMQEQKQDSIEPGKEIASAPPQGEWEKKLDPVPGEPLVPIEPLYTVDYFASQGIKLSAEELTKDKLGQNLRSFTEWLKTMKRIHPDKNTQEVDNFTNEKIQHIAEYSNEPGDVLTEAMAEVFAKQGLKHKAIEVYHKLSLLNPSKSHYFAAKISELNNN